MLNNMRKEYIALSVDQKFDNGPHNIFAVRVKRSWWRWWNQLSRFQRSLIYLFFIMGVLVRLYWWSVNHSEMSTENNHLPLSAKVQSLGDEAWHNPKFTSSNSERPHLVVDIQHPPLVAENIKDKNSVSDNVIEGVAAREESVGDTAAESNVADQPGTVKPFDPLVKPIPQKFSGPTNDRQRAVSEAFQHAWKGYKRFAWGHDNLKPISAAFHDWFGLGLTIVDSLDTMYIMGLEKEFLEAKEWVSNSMKLDINRDVNLFEVTIRVLGGLLSAYHLSGERIFLEKAVDLGDRLLPCFASDSGVPFSDVNLATKKAHPPKWGPDSSTSEVTTIQLEFRDLSRCTGDPKYEEAVARVSKHIHSLPKTDGLVPIFVNAHTGQFRSHSTITLGARGDSYYEYLLKQWLQTGRTIDYLRDDYLNAIEGVQKRLARRTPRRNLLFIGELINGGRDFKPKMDHLTCYLAGTMALGVHNGFPQHHMDLASDLLYTCYRTYMEQPTGLAAEITYFNVQEQGKDDMYVKNNDAHSLLRPETIESLWYMYQLTGNSTYQNWGWDIFLAIQKYTKVANGYTSIGNVKSPHHTQPKDMMESFFLGETLKYLYLLFADDRYLLDLDQYVINTEAHPFPIFDS